MGPPRRKYLPLPTLYGYRTLTFDSDYALLNSDYHRFTYTFDQLSQRERKQVSQRERRNAALPAIERWPLPLMNGRR